MSGNYDDTDRGALFKNERKASDTHSDYNGTINVGGREYWINAWLKTAKSGKKFMSLSVKPKEVKAGVQPRSEVYDENPAPRGSMKDELDDVPF